VASAIGESIQGEKRQCDVRKIIEKKKLLLWGVPVPDLLPVPQFPKG